jgi:hypothetical protein
MLIDLIDRLDVDVVEATDYRASAFFAFSELRTRPPHRRPLMVTFNHGLTEDVYWAASLRMSVDSAAEAALERQQCRASDLVLTPSSHAAERLEGVGVATPSLVSREPFEFSLKLTPRAFTGSVTHLGRVAVAKGIDKTVLLSNRIHQCRPLDRLLFVGALVPDPYRDGDIRQYITKRLAPDLAKSTVFTGALPRSAALSMLRPGDLAPHFSLSETFSYALLETLDHGLIPVVETGSPMAEFFPDDLHHLLIDPRMRDLDDAVVQVFKAAQNAPEVIERLQEFNEERLAPESVAGVTLTEYSRRLRELRRSRVAAVGESPKSWSGSDVTCLMAVHDPDETYYETIECLASQTTGPVPLIICSDGNAASASAIVEYAKLLLPDVTIIEQNQSGLLASRNTLTNHCQTPLALFLDADDWLHPRMIESGLEALNSDPDCAAAVAIRRSFGETDETVLRFNLGDYSHFNSNDLRMTALLKTDAVRQIMFDSFRRNGEADDWIFWLEFVTRHYTYKLLPEPLFMYRLHKGSMSWPWNPGQAVGTAKMLMDLTVRLAADPHWSAMVARAQAAARVVDW